MQASLGLSVRQSRDQDGKSRSENVWWSEQKKTVVSSALLRLTRPAGMKKTHVMTWLYPNVAITVGKNWVTAPAVVFVMITVARRYSYISSAYVIVSEVQLLTL